MFRVPVAALGVSCSSVQRLPKKADKVGGEVGGAKMGGERGVSLGPSPGALQW